MKSIAVAFGRRRSLLRRPAPAQSQDAGKTHDAPCLRHVIDSRAQPVDRPDRRRLQRDRGRRAAVVTHVGPAKDADADRAVARHQRRRRAGAEPHARRRRSRFSTPCRPTTKCCWLPPAARCASACRRRPIAEAEGHGRRPVHRRRRHGADGRPARDRRSLLPKGETPLAGVRHLHERRHRSSAGGREKEFRKWALALRRARHHRACASSCKTPKGSGTPEIVARTWRRTPAAATT